jgi:glycosyltransferase involved in cell wall biosynthesis
MGRAGQERVLQLHSPEHHRKAVLTLYKSIVPAVANSSAATPGSAGHSKCDSDEVSRPLRIAFIGGRGVVSKYSGIEAYYEEVGSRLAQRGHEVTIYCRPYFTPPVPGRNGMRLVRIPTLRSKHLDTLLHTAFSTFHVLMAHYDIVHYHALGPALFSALPRRFGTPTVVTVQGLDWQRKKWGRIAAAILRLGEHAAASLPDQTMVVSKTLRDYYRVRYGRETRYVANGALLREGKEARQLEQWGLRSEEYVLFLGRFSPEKNCHLLIQAFERISTTTKLVLAGGSSYSDAYAQQLRAHACERIRFLDYVAGDALDELLTHAMLFVLPSDLEGLSLALLDAMGAERCVLTSDIPENRELVDGAGFTFRRQDADDLERMLRLLINDPDARHEAGRLAKRRVQKYYNWDAITAQIEGIYMETLGWTASGKKRPMATAPTVSRTRHRVA